MGCIPRPQRDTLESLSPQARSFVSQELSGVVWNNVSITVSGVGEVFPIGISRGDTGFGQRYSSKRFLILSRQKYDGLLIENFDSCDDVFLLQAVPKRNDGLPKQRLIRLRLKKIEHGDPSLICFVRTSIFGEYAILI